MGNPLSGTLRLFMLAEFKCAIKDVLNATLLPKCPHLFSKTLCSLVKHCVIYSYSPRLSLTVKKKPGPNMGDSL